jgi:Bacterial mobilisation protein (MobC)
VPSAAAKPARANRADRREWRNRRPAAKQLRRTAEEIAQQEEERRAAQRTSALHVQLTKAEKAEIAARAKKSGNRVSDFARLVLLSDLKAPAPAERDPEAIRALAFQLSKIGTNLNQLAKIANETRTLPRETEFRVISAQLVAAFEKVIEL